ncbi:uncharacterized protein LOC131605259 [Vicia villosa]|uniref:uncharacterized protein LOC131605259 n=1 Tax=Vicia villosa TaxID=3911 RepID=UPI00273B8C22|nr:uncharacterized protein LOC131605259 [Vicia villosa]
MEDVSRIYKCKSKDLFEILDCIREISEVSITPRRDNLGTRFGFAKFTEVEDSRLLAVKLDNILFNGKNIHANVPRFNSKCNEAAIGRSLGANKSFGQNSKPRFMKSKTYKGDVGGRKDSRSFADVVADKIPSGNQPMKFKSFAYNSKEEDRTRYSKAYVSVLRCPGSACGIQESIEIAGFFVIKVTPMGANKCLLEEIEDGVMAEFLKEYDSWWKDSFVEIAKWKDEDVDSRRAVWFNLFGIPILVWNSNFFKLLANTMGLFISIDSDTANGRSMEVARIQVKLDLFSSVQELFVVIIDGKPFMLVIEKIR